MSSRRWRRPQPPWRSVHWRWEPPHMAPSRLVGWLSVLWHSGADACVRLPSTTSSSVACTFTPLLWIASSRIAENGGRVPGQGVSGLSFYEAHRDDPTSRCRHPRDRCIRLPAAGAAAFARNFANRHRLAHLGRSTIWLRHCAVSTALRAPDDHCTIRLPCRRIHRPHRAAALRGGFETASGSCPDSRTFDSDDSSDSGLIDSRTQTMSPLPPPTRPVHPSAGSRSPAFARDFTNRHRLAHLGRCLQSWLRRSRRWCRPPLFALRSTTAAQTTAALRTDPPAASRGGPPQSVNVVSGFSRTATQACRYRREEVLKPLLDRAPTPGLSTLTTHGLWTHRLPDSNHESFAATNATGASVCRQPEPSLRAQFHQPPPPRSSRQIPTIWVASIAPVVSPTALRAPVNDRCTRYGCLADGSTGRIARRPAMSHSEALSRLTMETRSDMTRWTRMVSRITHLLAAVALVGGVDLPQRPHRYRTSRPPLVRTPSLPNGSRPQRPPWWR